jgi:hypothetical protein
MEWLLSLLRVDDLENHSAPNILGNWPPCVCKICKHCGHFGTFWLVLLLSKWDKLDIPQHLWHFPWRMTFCFRVYFCYFCFGDKNWEENSFLADFCNFSLLTEIFTNKLFRSKKFNFSIFFGQGNLKNKEIFYPRVHAVYCRVYNLLCCCCHGAFNQSWHNFDQQNFIMSWWNNKTWSDMFRHVQTRSNLIWKSIYFVSIFNQMFF